MNRSKLNRTYSSIIKGYITSIATIKKTIEEYKKIMLSDKFTFEVNLIKDKIRTLFFYMKYYSKKNKLIRNTFLGKAFL